jgi:cysteinyl-tRNA synthetase
MKKQLSLYNSLTKKKEVFKPLNEDEITLYTCGPTVYSYAHIGNMSAYLMADLLIRVLGSIGYKVKQVKNITDVGHLVSDGDDGEDKMQKAAKKEQKTPEEIADFYTKAYIKDEKLLRMKAPYSRPKATDCVQSMIGMVEQLVKDGFAYETSDGVYMDITKIEEYGKLSGNTLEGLDAGARVAVNAEKRHPADFAVWKKADENHIQQWDSPWGRSFPGWHLECSAMAWEAFQGTYDIKTGGEDNIFPHHECEIAQTQALFGVKMANYYLHKRHIQLEGMKMSKSLGNIMNLQDLLEEGFTAEAVRYALITSHYRSRLNFQRSVLHEAQRIIDRGNKLIQKLHIQSKENSTTAYDGFQIIGVFDRFLDPLLDDLNMSESLVVMHEYMKYINTHIDVLASTQAENALKIMEQFNEILDVFTLDQNIVAIPTEIQSLAQERFDAKHARDFQRADMLRNQIQVAGYTVVDTKDGFQISPS